MNFYFQYFLGFSFCMDHVQYLFKTVEEVAKLEGIDRRRIGEWTKAKEKLAQKKK